MSGLRAPDAYLILVKIGAILSRNTDTSNRLAQRHRAGRQRPALKLSEMLQ